MSGEGGSMGKESTQCNGFLKELSVFRHSRSCLSVLVILRIRLSITADEAAVVDHEKASSIEPG